MKKSVITAYLGTALLLAGAAATATAENNTHVEGIVAGTYQAASQSHVDGEHVNDEFNGQLYLLGTLAMGPGRWTLEVRGSTTPRHDGVTSFYDSNALVGETLDPSGDGRIAATQLFYELPAGPGKFRVGLLDPTAMLDSNAVANDEYTQFLADAFVNNPTIGFPDFVLGGGYQADFTEHLGVIAFVGSDSGLGADDDPTYSNVFALGGDRAGHSKGVFTSAELDWHAGGYSLQGGVWYDTGRVDRVGSPRRSENSYGFYALAGAPVGPGRLEARAAIANEDAQAAANFLALMYQMPIKLAHHDTILSAAVARTGDSSDLPYHSKPIYQAELYWRINVVGPFYVSPDIQWIKHSQFQASRDDAVIGGARVSVVF
jgi:hypothetical protein